MNTIELRDLTDARTYLLQGLWMQRALTPVAVTVKPALEWALEIVGSGNPLPPLGFVADVGNIALGNTQLAPVSRDAVVNPHLPTRLARTYEDHVLGKFYTDSSFERAADALRRYTVGRDRARGLAFILNQFHERAQFDAVMLPPGVIRSIAEMQPEEVLAKGWESFEQDGPQLLLVDMYESLIARTRQTAEILGGVDIFELEHGTALAELGQRVALRQVLQVVEQFDRALPRFKVKPLAGRPEVPTRVLDEDTYPVGGFVSISTRGSIESLLHSQLAYMDNTESVDLFTIKYLRDELYYYSRDENQFLRRRRTFLFALYPDLVQARYKDRELPVQRIIMILALLVAGMRRLTEWLSTDALNFHIVLVRTGDHSPLAHERELLTMMLREPIANGSATVSQLTASELTSYSATLARRSMCQTLLVNAGGGVSAVSDDAVTAELTVDAPRPTLTVGDQPTTPVEANAPFDLWTATLERLLQLWV